MNEPVLPEFLLAEAGVRPYPGSKTHLWIISTGAATGDPLVIARVTDKQVCIPGALRLTHCWLDTIHAWCEPGKLPARKLRRILGRMDLFLRRTVYAEEERRGSWPQRLDRIMDALALPSKAALGRRIGASDQTVRQWFSGRQVPSPTHRRRLEALESSLLLDPESPPPEESDLLRDTVPAPSPPPPGEAP